MYRSLEKGQEGPLLVGVTEQILHQGLCASFQDLRSQSDQRSNYTNDNLHLLTSSMSVYHDESGDGGRNCLQRRNLSPMLAKLA